MLLSPLGLCGKVALQKSLSPRVLVSAKAQCSLKFFNSSSSLGSRRSKDYYSILGISKDASAKEIRAAYLEAVKKHHPDVTGSTDRRKNRHFHDVQEAFDILGSVEKKISYDNVRQGGYHRQMYTRQRYSGSVRQWDRQAGHHGTKHSPFEHFKEEKDDAPYTSAEHLTFFYCVVVSLFMLYVLYLFL